MSKMSEVFDCQEMPKEIKRALFDKIRHERGGVSNDVYIDYYVYGTTKTYDEIKDKSKAREVYPTDTDEYRWIEIGDDVVADWLFDQGVKAGSDAIVKYWW